MTLQSRLTQATAEEQGDVLWKLWLHLCPPKDHYGLTGQRVGDLIAERAYIDAVLMLMPEGARLRLDRNEDGRGAAWVWFPGDARSMTGDLYATPALALAAAILKAKELGDAD